MDYVGIDLHKHESQICTLTGDGELVEQRVRTERQRFDALFGDRPHARILIEASTESEWVARHLEAMGHEVIVADPNFAPMYSTRSNKVKTDRRDARALADACRLRAYRPAHRASDEQRHVRAQLSVREAMVRSRTQYISLARAILRREGLRVAMGAAERFGARVQRLQLPQHLRLEIEPLLRLLEAINSEIARAEKDIARVGIHDARVRRLQTVPSVGPITSAAFVATVDRVQRFGDAHQVQAYLGLVPREHSSGERQRKGSITKAGPPRLRWLLVQVAWSILRSRKVATEPLRVWAARIAERRGKRVAVVALARRMAGILFAIMRDESVYELGRVGQRATPAAVAAA